MPESFLASRVYLRRQLLAYVVPIMALLLCVALADLPCSDGFLISEHPASATEVGRPFSRHFDWKQHRQNSRQGGVRLVAETHGIGLATHSRGSRTVTTSTARGDRILTVSGDSNRTSAPPYSEVEALAAFKAAIKSDPSSALRSWIVGSAADNDSDTCTGWVGVTCSTRSPTHVVSLNLSNLQLVGSLHAGLRALAHLPFLQSLDLSVNVFSGFIPGESLTNFSHLSYFNLSSNVVTGEIPPETGGLLSLQDLDVSLNNLSGEIPASLGNCSSLRVLQLGSNFLQGEIPASLGALSHVEHLELRLNSLSGSVPGALGNCSSLRIIEFSNNLQLGGALPQELGLLKQLQLIYMEYNDFSGTFPVWIGNLTSLTLFSSFGNSFVGEIPDTIGQLMSLEYFNVANSQITGSIPVSIVNLTSLLLIQLQSDYLTGHIPSQIGMLPNLYWLNLAGNQLTGIIPSSLANCSSLSVLELGLNELMDPQPIPHWIGSLSSLSNIFFSFMNLQGELPGSTLGKLYNLVYFDAHSNNLTGTIPVSLQNCTYLRELDIGDNKLTGVIPPELGVLTSMSNFIVEINFLSGFFPEFVANWTQLSIFSLVNNRLGGLLDGRVKLDQLGQLGIFQVSGNDFEGPVPGAFGNASSIYLLALSSNRLSGLIPASLANMTSLQSLNLNHNSLEGAISVSLLKSGQSLSTLDLSQNQLEGSVPSEIGQLVQLEDLVLGNNKFTGIIPDTIGNCSKMANLDLSGNEFQGAIPAAAIAEMSSSLISLNLSRNLLSGTFPREFTQLVSVQAINISFNKISGTIPVGLGKCISLRSLDVSVNNLTGEIPQDLGSLTHLEFFNASFNDFTGPIPQSGIFNSSRINESSFLGNPGLCGASSIIGLQHQECAAILLNVSSHHRGCQGFGCKQVWIPVVVVSTMVLLGTVSILIALGFRYGWTLNRGGGNDSKTQLLMNFGAQMRFTERDVLRTIDDPAGDNVIGAGARSVVYKGVLPGGQVFALKKLLPNNDFQDPDIHDSSSKGAVDGELAKEAKILAKLRHKNILKCLSFFSNLDNRALIMEYMSGGSLHKHLHEVEPCSLTWQTRFKIAVGVAEGMKYLHHDFPEPLIHRDLKPNNIFLDADFEVKVGDFGISKFVTRQRDGEATASTICGTIGYMPPEYGTQTWVSTKGDVYSYGMVLIELLTGRQPCSMDDLEDEGKDLRSWVLDHFQGQPLEVLDPCLVSECNQDDNAKEQMTLLLRVSLLCTRVQPQSRPSMVDVVGMLAYIGNVGVKPAIRRTVEELTNDVNPSMWVAQDPISEGQEFNSNC